MLIGYARVSTQDQTLELPTDVLKQVPCEKMCTNAMSGSRGSERGIRARSASSVSPRCITEQVGFVMGIGPRGRLACEHVSASCSARSSWSA